MNSECLWSLFFLESHKYIVALPYETKNFTSDKAIYNYRIFSLGESLEPPVFLEGHVGDIATGGGIIWVKGPVWPAITKTPDCRS